MWLCAALAANDATAGSTPSRRTSSAATSATGGTRRPTCRQRERIVTSTSSAEGAQSSHTVRGGGSSIALSSRLPLVSLSRSASSTTMTRQRPSEGRCWASVTSGRTSSTRRKTCSVATSVTSAWPPDSAVRHSWHCPHPPRGHCSAAAKARAALDRPDPGGPVSSHAWVIPPACRPVAATCASAASAEPVGSSPSGSCGANSSSAPSRTAPGSEATCCSTCARAASAARRSTATASGWPTRSCQTVTGRPRRRRTARRAGRWPPSAGASGPPRSRRPGAAPDRPRPRAAAA